MQFNLNKINNFINNLDIYYKNQIYFVERKEEGWKKRENGWEKREFIDARMDAFIKKLFVPHSPDFYI